MHIPAIILVHPQNELDLIFLFYDFNILFEHTEINLESHQIFKDIWNFWLSFSLFHITHIQFFNYIYFI